MKLILIWGCVFLVGCSNLSIGVGYHKTPLPPSTPVLMGIPPAVIENIIAVIGTENFARIMEAALPENEKVYLGVWFEMNVK